MNRGNATVKENTQRPVEGAKANAPVGRRGAANDGLLRALCVAVVALCAIIVIMGLVLLILPSFHVEEIVVNGANYHTPEEIIAASGIKIGDETFSIDKSKVGDRIFKSCGNVQKISISRKLHSITITVTEGKNLMYTEHDGFYYMLDDTFRAWAVSDNEADFTAYPRIELPEIAGITLGNEIAFVSEDISYVRNLISYLEACGSFDKVSEIDVEKKYAVSYVLEDRCRINLGRSDDLVAKHSVAEKILAEKSDANDLWMVVDVSNLGKPTYRALTSSELLMK